MVLIFPPEPSKECVKVCHVIFECRVIKYHPFAHAKRACSITLHSNLEIFLKGPPAVETMVNRRVFER